MMRFFQLTIFIHVALGVVLEDPSNLNLETLMGNDSTSSTGPDSTYQIDERFAGSSGLFFLHLLKHKLNKLQYLEKISTTPSTLPNCICVPYYQCDRNNNIILDGFGNIDIRIRSCTGNQEVCCYLRIVTPMPSMPTTTMRPTMMMTMPPMTMPPMTMPPMTMPPMTMPPTTRPPMTMPPMTMPPMTMPTMTMPPMTMPTMTMPPMTMPPTTRPPMTMPPMTMPPTTRPPMTMLPMTTIPTFFPPVNCFCVYTWQCDANGYIISDGSGVINPRQTYYPVCSLPNQICCRVNPYPPTQRPVTYYPTVTVTYYPPTQYPIFTPYPSIDPRPFSPPTTLPTLPPVQATLPSFSPGQTCICILIVQCNIFGYIPINGPGSIDPRYTMGSLREMGSSCSNPSQMCCRIIFSAFQVLPTTNVLSQDVKYPGTSKACVCVKSWTCPGDNVVIPDAFGNIDPRLGACPNEDEVCCRLSNANMVSFTSTNIALDITKLRPNNIYSDSSCGYMSKTFAPAQPYPANSGNTYFAEFPWMVALLLRIPGQNDAFLCGASMINSRAVLTAGHCVENREIDTLVARFGEWDTNTTSEPLPLQEAKIQTVVRHPQYFNAALYHDLAILILQTPVTYSINVMPICLPQQGKVFVAGTRCYATGWGRSAFGAEGQYQSILRKIDLPLIDNEDCQNRLRQTRLGQYFQLHGSFVCAGGEESRDTCRGDGGGPLVCSTSTGQYVQVGIVSWGIGCGTSTPAVYASVAQHRLWIDQQLANYGVS